MSAQEGWGSALSDVPMPSPPAETHQSDSDREALHGDGPEGSSDENEGQSSLPAAREEIKNGEEENKRLRALTNPSFLDHLKEEGEEVKGMHGREKLKRHRVEVAGRAWVPKIWGQEELLKDWVDCSVFEASFLPARIMLAKAALAEEGRRATPGGLRIENRC